MTNRQPIKTPALVVAALMALLACAEADDPVAATPDPAGPTSLRSFDVQGTGVHFFSTAITHSAEPTQTGQRLRSTDIIRLEGDLDGFVLYHPTTVIDGAAGTMTNTGTQIFSGTIAGSDPVILHDDRFEFTVDLETGATLGRVYLGRSQDAPHPETWFECELEIVGTGMTAAGDGLATYTGRCEEMQR